MLVHPEIQHKAQAEVDSVVGADRLPDFTHKPQLPYLEAVLKEVLRLVRLNITRASAAAQNRLIKMEPYHPYR
jgi:cytochrome P450